VAVEALRNNIFFEVHSKAADLSAAFGFLEKP
jgi:hypothetical protein